MPRSGLLVVIGLAVGMLVGCAGGHSTPMATDGPNQVVIKVPEYDLTRLTRQREECPRDSTVGRGQVDRGRPKIQQAKFTVKDKTAFNLDEVKQVLGDQYRDGVTVLAGPTD